MKNKKNQPESNRTNGDGEHDVEQNHGVHDVDQNHGEVIFCSIEEALEEIRSGRFVVVADDEGRENEGDLIGAAELVTPAMINFMVTESRGWVCLAITSEKANQLQLPM